MRAEAIVGYCPLAPYLTPRFASYRQITGKVCIMSLILRNRWLPRGGGPSHIG